MKNCLRVLAVSAVLTSSAAWSVPYFEAGDAGQSLATAQAVGNDVNVIDGNIVLDSADMYSFNWGGGALTLDTFGSSADTQLFLFDSLGHGVWANDEAPGVYTSSIIIAPALTAGQYFIGLSDFDYDPYSSAGVMFPSAPFTGQFGPSNLASLDHWGKYSPHHGGAGHYVINFNATSVDEPATLVLFGFMFGALAFAVRKRLIKR